MELHENLYALGLRLGRDIFDDAEGFRGAVDDFLDEDAATTGDINLLVDAVRLGALRTLTSMLDSGADVGRAIEEAGNRLARDRQRRRRRLSVGCAVLGFAVGRVSDVDVRRYRTQQAGQTTLPPHNPPQTPLPRTPHPSPRPAPRRRPRPRPASARRPSVSPPPSRRPGRRRIPSPGPLRRPQRQLPPPGSAQTPPWRPAEQEAQEVAPDRRAWWPCWR